MSLSHPGQGIPKSRPAIAICGARITPSRNAAGSDGDEKSLAAMLRLVAAGGDAGKLARRMLEHFGALQRVVASSVEELMSVDGVTARIAAQVQSHYQIALGLQRASLRKRDIIRDCATLLSYLKVSVSHADVEVARLLLLDPRNGLIDDIELGHGTTNQVAIYPAEVLRWAIMRRATALILVHNHPSGDPTPSAMDIAMTQQIREAVEPLQITLHDHIIVGGDQFYSMLQNKILPSNPIREAA